MRPLIYHVACSIDGFIAHKDGSFDGFVPDGEPVTDYLDSLSRFDAVVMGRKTYDVGLQAGQSNPYPSMKSYVFTRSIRESPHENVTLLAGDAPSLVANLKAEPGGPIYLCGGGDLAAQLFAGNLIDTIILKVNPFVMGSGIPLFEGVVPQTQLELTKSTAYSNGCIWLHYRMKQ